MSLSRKLLGGFGVMLGLVLLLGAAAAVSLQSLSGDLDRAAKVTARKQYLAGRVNAAASEMTGEQRGSVLASVIGDKEHASSYQDQFQRSQAQLQDALSELRRMSDGGSGEASLRRIEEASDAVRQGQQELQTAINNQQLDAALAIFGQKLQRTGSSAASRR